MILSRQRAFGGLCVVALAATVAAQSSPGVHPVTGRVYARTMSVEGAAWLERPEREAEERPDLALRLLDVQPGDMVADIGAGSGYYTIRLARAVGPDGRVYANDIQPGMLSILTTNAFLAKLSNVVPVLGTQTRPNLPADRIDLVIMVDVYHEFSEPQAMLQGVRQALKPGGRLALFEYRAEDPDVPILRDHKMTKAQVRQEVEAEGFEQVRVFDDLPWQHLIVFRKP